MLGRLSSECQENAPEMRGLQGTNRNFLQDGIGLRKILTTTADSSSYSHVFDCSRLRSQALT